MRGKQFTAYAIVSTLLEEIAIAVIGLWLLPELGIHVPIWVVVLIMVGWAAYNIITYKPSKRVLDKHIPSPAEDMIGCEGTARTCLDPNGMVQVRGALWKATATDSTKPSIADVAASDSSLKSICFRKFPETLSIFCPCQNEIPLNLMIFYALFHQNVSCLTSLLDCFFY